MGYRRKVKTYDLTWAEGHELHGLEVTVKGLSVETMLELAELAAGLTKPGAVADSAAKSKRVFRTFADRLVSWNLEDDDGAPVPATYDGVAAQDLPFVLDIVLSWMEAIASVDTPLPKPSNGSAAAPSPELSLPMAPLSPSHTN